MQIKVMSYLGTENAVALTPTLSQSLRVLKDPTAKRSPSGLQDTEVIG